MTEPTVLDIFKIAYGPLPEGATQCFIGNAWSIEPRQSAIMGATVKADGPEWPWVWVPSGLKYWTQSCFEFPIGPDIATRPARAFIGFFGDAYDKACEEWK